MPDDTAHVPLLILERPLCVDCIATKSGVGAGEIERLLVTFSATIALSRTVDRCRACGQTTRVYSALRTG